MDDTERLYKRNYLTPLHFKGLNTFNTSGVDGVWCEQSTNQGAEADAEGIGWGMGRGIPSRTTKSQCKLGTPAENKNHFSTF